LPLKLWLYDENILTVLLRYIIHSSYVNASQLLWRHATEQSSYSFSRQFTTTKLLRVIVRDRFSIRGKNLACSVLKSRSCYLLDILDWTSWALPEKFSTQRFLIQIRTTETKPDPNPNTNPNPNHNPNPTNPYPTGPTVCRVYGVGWWTSAGTYITFCRFIFITSKARSHWRTGTWCAGL